MPQCGESRREIGDVRRIDGRGHEHDARGRLRAGDARRHRTARFRPARRRRRGSRRRRQHGRDRPPSRYAMAPCRMASSCASARMSRASVTKPARTRLCTTPPPMAPVPTTPTRRTGASATMLLRNLVRLATLERSDRTMTGQLQVHALAAQLRGCRSYSGCPTRPRSGRARCDHRPASAVAPRPHRTGSRGARRRAGS